MRHLLLLLLTFLSLFSSAQELLSTNASFQYFKGTIDPGTWTSETYQDAHWLNGNAPFRYGDGNGGTVLSDMPNTYTTFYLRKKLQIDSLGSVDKVSFFVDYDDGFKLWINGVEVIQANSPTISAYNSTAVASHESGTFELFQVDSANSALKNGINTIAIQCFNANIGSSDIYFNLSMQLISRTPPRPKADAPIISHKGGFYDTPFTTTIQGANPGDTIKYTLDCSNPQTSPTAIVAKSPVNVSIHPDDITYRPKTPAVVLRASAFQGDLQASFPVSSTFIYIERVKTQTYPGSPWPNAPVNSQIFDYAMDPNIVFGQTYADKIDEALLDIPTLSLVTDLPNLVDPNTGIYVNAGVRSEDFEVPASIELINPDGDDGFQTNAGLRIRGGWSRHPDNPKHAFRLFFRSVYGDAKLNYPLFGDEGSETYDKIDLRTSQNYSWSYHQSPYNTMTRDVFSRDLQREMGQPYTRSRYYHLYLNGLYWGLYQTQERAEARFAESYLGGDKEDYDVVKVNTQNYSSRTIEATDGNLDAWQALWNVTEAGYDTNANYYKIQGLNEAGQIDTSMSVLVDMDNLIDYMLIIFYAGNFDAPYSKFGDFMNNFFNIRNRKYKRQGFNFLIHDAEHSLLAHPASPGVGPTEDRVNISMNVNGFGDFQAQWLHYRLTSNSEYRLRFADRAYKYLYNNGVLTPDRTEELFRSRTEEIEMAIIAESARWGDSKRSTAYTKQDWEKAVKDVANLFIGQRTGILINQLETNNLLPLLHAPMYIKGTTTIAKQSIELASDFSLSISNPNTVGTIYYTLDGSDPRGINGVHNPTSKIAGRATTLNITTTLQVKARIKNGSVWSPVHELVILADDNLSDLKVTEIHYHPSETGPIPDKNKEFIELKNTSDHALNISGLTIDSAIYFKFPKNSILNKGSFAVLASHLDNFEYVYGTHPSGEYKGHLSNDGEQLIFLDKNNTEIESFWYFTSNPWPLESAGLGNSLVPTTTNPSGDPQQANYWRASSVINGSPFADDLWIAAVNDIHPDHTSGVLTYPNPTRSWVNIKLFDSNQKVSYILLSDLRGAIVGEFKNTSGSKARTMRINLNELAIQHGLYVLSVITSTKTYTSKLIYQE